MRVLLATSPHVRHAAVLQSDFAQDNSVMYSFAPIGLLSLAAAVRLSDVEADCAIYDLNRRILAGDIPLGAGLYDALAEDLRSRRPDVVGFMTECDSYHHVIQICAALKRRLPACQIVLGGPHASAVGRITMEKVAEIDAIVVGEGEVTFPELLAAINSGSDVAVPGSIRRVGVGIVEGPARALIESLDRLPVPAFDLYLPDPGEEMFLEVGRGCPFQCEFCSTAPYWYRRHRVKSPKRILDEICTIQHLFGTKRVHFTHDLFTTNRAWVKAVCDALLSAGTPVAWTCSARTDTVDEDLLRRMKEAGCSAIYFGLESGSERILREIRKDIPLSHSLDIISTCRRVGITPNAGLIVGFPSEDDASLRETFSVYERLLRLGCRPAHIFAFCPFADAAIYSKLEGLVCTGHFVDLPMGPEADVRNRAIIASDSSLYASYFRPNLPELVPGEPHALAALDEFSCLVEAAPAPALALSEIIGGLHEVFCGWLRWIQKHNHLRRAQPYRSGYGSAAMFARYLLDELKAEPSTSVQLLSIARAVETNLRIAETAGLGGATTMASHRSFVLPDAEQRIAFALDTHLFRGAVVETLALPFDVTPVFAGGFDTELAEEPTFLAWQVTSPDSVRLIRIDRAVFDALELLRNRSATVGELLIESFGRTSTADALRMVAPDAIIASLESAAHEGLISVQPV
jgi:tRNA A37 methylthiotransferase MiaB